MKVPNIWVTIGSKGFDRDKLEKLVQYNVAGIRINKGRCSCSWINKVIMQLDSLGYPLQRILLDIGNTKIRLRLRSETEMQLTEGDLFIISNEQDSESHAWLDNHLFFDRVQSNDVVYFGDGEIEGIIEQVNENYVKLRIITSGVIQELVSVGIKGMNLSSFNISEKEILEVNSILERYPIQLILSFVDNENNVKWAKKKFKNAHAIIPKIETMEAYRNINNILSVSDSIFIGRGDLGLSAGIEKIGVLQYNLIKKGHQMECKICIGTGILDSLKWSEVPLRAEISDITNLCVLGIETIVLTSETGGSENPFKAIDYLKKILNYLENVE